CSRLDLRHLWCTARRNHIHKPRRENLRWNNIHPKSCRPFAFERVYGVHAFSRSFDLDCSWTCQAVGNYFLSAVAAAAFFGSVASTISAGTGMPNARFTSFLIFSNTTG